MNIINVNENEIVKQYNNTVRLSGVAVRLIYRKTTVRVVLAIRNEKTGKEDYPEILFSGEMAEFLRRNVNYRDKISIIAEVSTKKIVTEDNKVKNTQFYFGKSFTLNSIGYQNSVDISGDL